MDCVCVCGSVCGGGAVHIYVYAVRLCLVFFLLLFVHSALQTQPLPSNVMTSSCNMYY